MWGQKMQVKIKKLCDSKRFYINCAERYWGKKKDKYINNELWTSRCILEFRLISFDTKYQ